MKTAIQCIILLACAAICTSTPILWCQCLKTLKAVNPSLIADAKEYKPRPYCNKTEVIVILKDKSSRCLDPKENFTQAVLRIILQRAMRAEKMNTSGSKTTTASTTTPATVTPTSS